MYPLLLLPLLLLLEESLSSLHAVKKHVHKDKVKKWIFLFIFIYMFLELSVETVSDSDGKRTSRFFEIIVVVEAFVEDVMAFG